MAKKNRGYSRKSRKTGKRKSKRNASRRIPKMPVGIPNYMFARMRYTSVRQASVAATSDDTRYWRLNSVYDPDYSGVGHQVYYHDQYSAIYQTYIVYAVKVTMKVTCASSTANMYYPAMCMCPYSGAAPSWSSFETMKEATKAQSRVLIPGQTVALFKAFYKINSIFGVPKLTVKTDDGFAASVFADPANVAYLVLRFQNQDGATAVTYSADLSLTYYVKYFQRQNPVSS